MPLQHIMLTPLQQCQSAMETASMNTNSSEDNGIEIPGWDRPQGRESQRQGPHGKAHAGTTRGGRQDGRRRPLGETGYATRS